MSAEGDITVYDQSDRLVAVVLIAPKPIVPVRDLRNSVTTDAFVLVVSRQSLYLWPPAAHDEPPFAIPSADVLGERLRRIRTTIEEVTVPALEVVTGLWLADLADGFVHAPDFVSKSGFMDVLRGSRVEFAKAA